MVQCIQKWKPKCLTTNKRQNDNVITTQYVGASHFTALNVQLSDKNTSKWKEPLGSGLSDFGRFYINHHHLSVDIQLSRLINAMTSHLN